MSKQVFFTVEKNFYQTKVEMKDFAKASRELKIGIAKETFPHEKRFPAFSSNW